MKKYISILAGAALLAACEQKTETAAPAASPKPEAAETATESTNSTPPPASESPAETGGTTLSGATASPTP